MLHGKNVIITGARRGIGRALVMTFASYGANIWACARTQNESFEADMQTLAETYGVWIKPVYFELTDKQAQKAAIRTIIGAKLPVDVLVNNAGMAHGGLLQMTSLDTIRQVFEVNFFAQIAMMQEVCHVMMRQKSGCIVNMCSVAGIDGDPGYVAYGSSKAALAFATKSVAKEMAQYNVRINGVAPGLSDTHMAVEMENRARSHMIGASAMNRLGKPEEIAEVVAFLASEKASFITGQILRVDGGM